MTTSWGAADGQAGQAAGQLSFKCSVNQGKPHTPCAGTTDDGNDLPCRCRCHRRRLRVQLCAVQRVMLTAMLIIAVCGISAAYRGRPVAVWEYLVMSSAALLAVLYAFSMDADFHAQQVRLNARQDKLNRAHRNLILAAEEIGIRLDTSE